MSILIAIPTFRRPEMLARLLDSLTEVAAPESLAILVADNDAEGAAGAALVRTRAAQAPHPLRALVVPGRGLAAVRNAILTEFLASGADWLAMVDDDQTVDPAFLAEALAMARTTGAGAVGCAVPPVFAPGANPRVTRAAIYRRDVTTSGRVARLYGTNGVLLSRAAVLTLDPPWFRAEFNRSGGEDADFFRRLARAGVIAARAPRAIVYEHYPAERLTAAWVLRRAQRIGNSDARADLLDRGGIAARAQLFAAGLASVVLASAHALGAAFGRGAPIDAAARAARGVGKISAALGRVPELYGGTPEHGPRASRK